MYSYSAAFIATGTDYSFSSVLNYQQTFVSATIVQGFPIPTISAAKIGDDVQITLGNLITGQSYNVTYEYRFVPSGAWTVHNYGNVVAVSSTMGVTDSGVFTGHPSGQVQNPTATHVP